MSEQDVGGNLQVDVEVGGEGALPSDVVVSIVSAALEAVSLATGTVDLGVQFVGEERIAQLNQDHRGVDAPTDVLSFPIDGREDLPDGIPRQLGDVVVCPGYVEAQLAESRNMVPGDDPAADRDLDAALRRCVAHGVLHLLGLDHVQDDEAERMFELEQRVLDAARKACA